MGLGIGEGVGRRPLKLLPSTRCLVTEPLMRPRLISSSIFTGAAMPVKTSKVWVFRSPLPRFSTRNAAFLPRNYSAKTSMFCVARPRRSSTAMINLSRCSSVATAVENVG